MQTISEIFTNTNTLNTSDSVVKITNTNTLNTSKKTLPEVQMIAFKIEEMLGAQVESSFEFYCKVAWKLPENQIWNIVEMAKKGNYPHRLFTYLAKQYMKKAP